MKSEETIILIFTLVSEALNIFPRFCYIPAYRLPTVGCGFHHIARD
jgi:hypothetical protein